MNSYYHARSSAKKHGGVAKDYQEIHDWFDQSKAFYANFRHRAARHHAEGIFQAEDIFGTTITNSNGREVPVRLIGEQHVMEDLGFIPTLQDWLKHIQAKPWMNRVPTRSQKLLEELENDETPGGEARELPRVP